MTTPPRRKKLIEVALPLEAINVASAREKSIRHGHPSTLHLWWARRPLAACRAVLFAQLVDDPSSDPAFRNADGTIDEERAGIRRAELFDVIENLVKWENSNNPKVINAARAEIAASVASRKVELGELQKDTIVFGKDEGEPHPDGPLADDGTTAWRVMLRRSKPEVVNHFLLTYAPPVLDPFAGGGSIPLEAQRLGLRAHASDLNPVPVLINKALIEIPPKFANQPPVHPDVDQRTGWSGAAGLAEDVRRYGQWMRNEAEKQIGHLYPKILITQEMANDREDLQPYVGQEVTAIAWLWARTVPSPDPSLGGTPVPLVRSYWLSKKKGKEAYVRPLIDKSRGTFRFQVKRGRPKDGFDPEHATILTRQGGRCLISNQPMPFEYIRRKGKDKEMGERLMAIVCEGQRERIYLSPLPEHEALAKGVEAQWRPDCQLPQKHRNFQTPVYGMDNLGDIFTERQLTALLTLGDLVSSVREMVHRDAQRSTLSDHEGYANAIATFMAFAIDKGSNYWSSLCGWHSGRDIIVSTFGRQALPMVWDYAEANPLSSSTGNILSGVDSCAKSLDAAPASGTGRVVQVSAVDPSAYNGEVIATDPPYYDNIAYADLSDFFYVWLRRSLRDVYPNLLGTMLTPKTDELIASPHRHGGSKEAAAAFFERGLGRAIGEWRKHGDSDVPTTIFYAFKQAETDAAGTASTGWETFLAGVIEHGFAITATWPMRTELIGNLKKNVSALASSIVLACVPRMQDAALATRREFADTLRSELPEAIRHLQSGNVAPVDLAQASIGPGIGVFSRYSKVVNADGSPMTVREALQLINQVLDEALSEQESDFDAETRFALKWFEQYGMKDGAFGDAETLAKAMAVSVQGVVESGVAVSRAGKVRLLSTDELDPAWDPQTDDRLTIWEVTHHLIRELEQNGEPAAADLLRRVGSGAGQTARELAYRLYQTCERKKWADWARSYNGLVVSWPEIERLSREAAAQPAESAPADAGLFESE